ncbi:MAG TPA: ABC-type transport auxiliary lipoprotein family protein [Thermoanaerobaculia bacterium]|nr:ABC-type transport auxiliary lipoprotein family protein [Thermoanaerobaculia bacterium]
MPHAAFRPEPNRARRAAALAAALLLGAACASKLPQVPQTFTIDGPPPRTSPPQGATRVLSLRRAEAAPAYAGSELVYRVGAHGIERDPYASFAAPASWMVTSAIRGYLKNADWVRDVVEPGEGIPVAAEIEPSVVEIAGDFTNPAEPAAVLTVSFRVLAPASGAAPPRELLLKTYTARRPLDRRAAAAVVAAWNQELSEIMVSFAGDLKAALPPAP